MCFCICLLAATNGIVSLLCNTPILKSSLSVTVLVTDLCILNREGSLEAHQINVSHMELIKDLISFTHDLRSLAGPKCSSVCGSETNAKVSQL